MICNMSEKCKEIGRIIKRRKIVAEMYESLLQVEEGIAYKSERVESVEMLNREGPSSRVYRYDDNYIRIFYL